MQISLNWSEQSACAGIFGIGLSRVLVLPLGVAAKQSVHYFWDYWYEVRVLPLGVASGRSRGGGLGIILVQAKCVQNVVSTSFGIIFLLSFFLRGHLLFSQKGFS